MTSLRLDVIQGNIVPGFCTDYQALLLLRFPHRAAANTWLRLIQPHVTSARQVVDATLGTSHGDPTEPVWTNVGFAWRGLQRLGSPQIERFSTAFREGLRQRATRLGDGDDPTIARWQIGGTEDTEADALLLLAADQQQALQARLHRETARIVDLGVQHLAIYDGASLPGQLRGHEHFGFRDGLSQPLIRGLATPPNVSPDEEAIAAGEFVLGYPDESGGVPDDAPDWAGDGSFLVFRRLQQHVAAFRQMLAREAARVGLTPQQLSAKMMGRWPSGAKLGSPLEERDPGVSDPRTAEVVRSDFCADPKGERVPRFAHIRKARPRDFAPEIVNRRRLIRRAIPYGTPLPEGVTRDDGHDRGLLFLAYQANIARQFEHIQREWLRNPSFPHLSDGPDPLFGAADTKRPVCLQHNGAVHRVGIEQYVTVTGGGYFFVPSIPALHQLVAAR